MTEEVAAAAAARVREALGGFTPRVLLTLGSGLGGLADEVEAVADVPFGEVGLPETTVPGHAGRLIAGHLGGVPVLCQQAGRSQTSRGSCPALAGCSRPANAT